jgi:hypothetical protein
LRRLLPLESEARATLGERPHDVLGYALGYVTESHGGELVRGRRSNITVGPAYRSTWSDPETRRAALLQAAPARTVMKRHQLYQRQREGT